MEWWIKFVVATCFAVIGFSVSRWLRVGKPFEYLNDFLFYGVIPATIFLSVARAPSVPLLLALTAVSALHMVGCTVLALAVFRRFGEVERATMVLLSSLPNVVFLAFPLAIALLGSVTPVIPYAIAFNALLPGYVAWLSKSFSGRGKAKPRSYPHVAAFVAGAIANYMGLSSAISRATSIPAVSTAITILNLAAFAIIGSELARVERIDVPRIGLVAIYRFGVSPLLMAIALLALSTLIEVPKGYVVGSVMQSLMAPAVTNVILAKAFGLDTSLASSAVALLTPVSVAIAVALTVLVAV